MILNLDRMRSFEFLREPVGAAFNLLLDFSLHHCPVFSISEHEIVGWSDFAPFQLGKAESDDWRMRCRLRAGELRSFFRVTEKSLHLLRALDRLYRCPPCQRA